MTTPFLSWIPAVFVLRFNLFTLFLPYCFAGIQHEVRIRDFSPNGCGFWTFHLPADRCWRYWIWFVNNPSQSSSKIRTNIWQGLELGSESPVTTEYAFLNLDLYFGFTENINYSLRYNTFYIEGWSLKKALIFIQPKYQVSEFFVENLNETWR